ncbi:MAG TPA: AarF/UbiB family protein [Thermoanaerobaculia bacterium]|nr:AarF/UbiB family protein [Thermoanaerobaculia bacterium]
MLLRYGRSEVLAAAQRDPLLADLEPPPPATAEEAERLARDLEALGPTFIKLGQLLSTRSDLLPPPYLEALSRLQDEVEPFSYGEVEQIVSEELGVRISKAFGSFEATPAASASLGQVHRATLRDGRAVAVKVQRPGIRPRVLADLEAIERLVGFVQDHSERARRFRLAALLEEFRRSLVAELDYRREAQNLLALGRTLEPYPHLTVPRPIDDYSTSRVLTMEYVDGAKLDEVSPLARLELDGAALADELFEAYLVQVLVEGLFHADPHPGNLLLTRDGRLALIDLGMVGHVAPGLRDRLLKLLIALGEGKSDEVADHALAMSRSDDDSDRDRFRREVDYRVLSLRDAAIEDIAVGRALLDLTGLAGECGVWMPQELSLLGKALLNLDHIARQLDPGFDPNAAIRRHAGELMRRRMLRDLSPGSVVGGLLEAKELAEQLPARVNQILGHLAENRLRVEVDAIDETEIVRAVQKVANRITTGVVLAALIVGAALMMRVETAFRLFGYPGFAMLCFLAAAAGGVALLWDIVRHDRRAGQRR